MTTSPTLDQAPPDWAAYAAVMADYSEDCNRWRGRQRAVQAVKSAHTVMAPDAAVRFFEWLNAE